MVFKDAHRRQALPLSSLNHISRNCRDIEASVAFYQDILGFIQIVRPQSPPFNFDGAWLFQYGIGIHLLKEESKEGIAALERNRGKDIDPRADHISFQADNTGIVEQRLQEFGINFRKQTVVEGNVRVQQIFFHDPDGHMIEICDCEALPIIPISGECTFCPARFKYGQTAWTGEEMETNEITLRDTVVPSIEKDKKWGLQTLSSQVGLPATATCGDIPGSDMFPVCA